MKNPDLMFDRRIVERNVANGLLTEADYQSHLEGLADAEQNAEFVVVGGDEAGESAEAEAPAEAED